ncbi:MAG: hypothetical protein ACLURV_07025 [Gallintestinimicrobium sp.]
MRKRNRIVVTHEEPALCKCSDCHPSDAAHSGAAAETAIGNPDQTTVAFWFRQSAGYTGKYLDGTQDLIDPEGHGTYVYELLKNGTGSRAYVKML